MYPACLDQGLPVKRIALGLMVVSVMGWGCSSGTAGSSDAGPSDAGPVDAGPVDAGQVTDAGPQCVPTVPPSPTSGASPADGTGSVTFAISKLYLGDTDPDGTSDKLNGWKQFGYNIDGLCSSASSTDLCKPADNASHANVYPDGNGGIDNAFGEFILPIILSVASDASARVNQSIAGGDATVLFEMQKLGTSTDYTPLNVSVFNGGDLGAVPRFDGTDAWPVLSSSLNDGATLASGAKISGPNGYLAGDTWVSGDLGPMPLTLYPFGGGVRLILPIDHAVITLQLDATHQHGTKGVISGVMDTQLFLSGFRETMGRIDPTLCSGPTVDSISTQIVQGSDILDDGTQDPTKVCDSISVGIGFDAYPVQLGAVQQPPTPLPSPCPDAGSDGGA